MRAGLPGASKSRNRRQLRADAGEVRVDLLDGEQLALGGLAARVADHAGAAAHDRDRAVAEALHAREGHHRQQRADVQAVRRRIEADVQRHLLAGQHVAQALGGLVDQPAPLQFGECVGRHRSSHSKVTTITGARGSGFGIPFDSPAPRLAQGRRRPGSSVRSCEPPVCADARSRARRPASRQVRKASRKGREPRGVSKGPRVAHRRNPERRAARIPSPSPESRQYWFGCVRPAAGGAQPEAGQPRMSRRPSTRHPPSRIRPMASG